MAQSVIDKKETNKRMISTMVNVRERVHLRACKTEKFKAETFSMSAAIPLTKDRYLTTLLFAVLCRGCEKYPSQSSINRRLSYLWGADLSVRDYTVGQTHIIGLYADFVSPAYLPQNGEDLLFEVLDLMKEVLLHPVLDENGLLDAHYVESEKRLQCDAIRAKKNSPRAYAFDRCAELMLAGSPMGLSSLGTVEQVEAVTPERLTAHWRELVGAMHLDCFYLGVCDAARVSSVLTKVLDGELVGDAPRIPTTVFARPVAARDLTVHEESLPVTQGQLVMGLRFSEVLSGRRYFAATLLQAVLGASPVSKLFVNVRERLGLCYFCHALVSRYASVAFVRCGLDEENRALAEKEILSQISLIADGEISDAEWEAARTSLIDSLHQTKDCPSAIDRFYFNRSLSGMETSVEAEAARILSVTREEVAALAREAVLDTVFFLHPTRAGEGEEDEDDES